MPKSTTDPVFAICELMLRNSPEASYTRLNGALCVTLRNCIQADLPFKPDTFQRIAATLRGGWWFGDGAGSHYGEHFYTTACECNHASAQQSFEKFAGRPAVLWEEDCKTPERLHVGSRFTWKGVYVTVTSMRKDSLVACSYKDRHYDSINGIKVGATIGYNPRHLITEAKKEGTATILRVVPQKASEDGRQITKRFTIPYAEIAELRKTAKARVKAIIRKIETCDPEKDRAALLKEVSESHFRHLEREEIDAAYRLRKELLAGENLIENWRKGRNDAYLGSKAILLRIKGDRVQCSNGNSVGIASAARVLPVLLQQRKKAISLNLPVDSYLITRLSASGVKIGCTLVPWPEIERIAPQLTA